MYNKKERSVVLLLLLVESSWNLMGHGDAREGNWRRNWEMEWVTSTLLTTSERVVSNIIATDAHTSPGSSRMNWSPRRFKRTRPFRRKTKYGFCACAITFQKQSTTNTSITQTPPKPPTPPPPSEQPKQQPNKSNRKTTTISTTTISTTTISTTTISTTTISTTTTRNVELQQWNNLCKQH